MKKLVSFLLCLALLLGIAPVVIANTQTEGIFTYTIDKNSEATLTHVAQYPETLYLPETLGGHTVTRIASYAISGSAKNVIVPETVTYMEQFAISDSFSAKVYILSKDIQLEESAVSNVHAVYGYDSSVLNTGVSGAITHHSLNEYPSEPWTLQELTEGNLTYALRDGEAIVLKAAAQIHTVIPQTLGGCPVTRIAPYALATEGISTLSFSEGLKSIGAHAVDNPYFHSTVALPSTLEYVGEYAFHQIKTSGDLPSIKHIGTGAFSQGSRTQIIFGEQLEYIGDYAFSGNRITEATIPASTKYMGIHVFGYDSYDKTLEITILSKDVVCNDAFGRATRIIGYMGSTAMQEAIRKGIRFVDIETEEVIPAAYTTQKRALEYCIYYDRAEIISVCDTQAHYDVYSIEETVENKPVTVIKEGALGSLKAYGIVIPNTVTTIEENAFYGNHFVQEILMSENIETLSEGTFGNCISLRLLFWPDNAHEITLNVETNASEDVLFPFCEGAYFITLPNSKVEAFAKKGDYHFLPLSQDLAYLTDGVGVYSTDGKEATLHAMYYEGNSNDPGDYTIPDMIYDIPVTRISGDTYWGYSMSSLYLGSNIQSVEDGAFVNCRLTELAANKDVKHLPYPLVPEGLNGRVYGYADTYTERFCKEHDYLFYPIDDVPFKDVKKSDWYFASVYFCYITGLMNGTSETTFEPNGTTTRAMLAQVLYNMSGAPGCSWEYGFKDVKRNDWFCEAVNWCKWYGLGNGTSEFYFSPNQNVTREQVATFLYRYAQVCQIPVTSNGNLSAFNDKNRISSYAKEALRWAVEYGIVNGQTDTTLNPQGYATRAEIATMLMRFVAYLEPYVQE